MMLVPILALASLAPPPAEVDLQRVFQAGEKGRYSVKSSLQIEVRGGALLTWMPQKLEVAYDFHYGVTELKSDGIARILYERPTMTEIRGETFSTPKKTTVEKVDLKLDVTLSPINEMLDVKDLNPKKPGGKGGGVLWRSAADREAGSVQDVIGQFVGEIYRLALFLGALDSSLDFSPKLPYDAVKVGDTWKRTVGYSPQALGGKGGQLAVQRLDYTFTYKGEVEVEGRKFQRVTAELGLKTDLGQFINQLLELKPSQSGLKEVPLSLDASIDYDLDLSTRRTVRAVARSEGGFSIVLTREPNAPVHEEKFKGTTKMALGG